MAKYKATAHITHGTTEYKIGDVAELDPNEKKSDKFELISVVKPQEAEEQKQKAPKSHEDAPKDDRKK